MYSQAESQNSTTEGVISSCKVHSRVPKHVSSPLLACASIVARTILTYKDFNRAESAQHNSCLVHVIHVFWQDSRILQHLPVHFEPLCDLPMYVVPVALPVYRSHCSRFEFWVAFLEGASPVLSGGLVGLFVADRWRATLKASEGTNLIRTGCPRANISKKKFTTARSSSEVRYCWRWAVSCFESLPRAR
jgi:hypothetical protein